ncbi:hypothetical protein Vadar_021223 [Vaccinium darrowii]|uniref:Uncharacterized protein n=1 Tax=Vaccinium darrowii TaxID=229202 RepID=A0ACB7Y7W7_9ERIC|nr:hypothetical protein Vadar_021223 [Vaccinium darrowii]
MAETCWEKRVFTSIKIKKGNDFVGKEDVIEINPGDDVSVDFEVKDALMKNSDGSSRVDLLDASIHNDLDLDVDVDLEDGINDGHALKEDSLLQDAPISLLQQNGFMHTTFDESIPDAEVTTSSGSVDSSSDDLVIKLVLELWVQWQVIVAYNLKQCLMKDKDSSSSLLAMDWNLPPVYDGCIDNGFLIIYDNQNSTPGHGLILMKSCKQALKLHKGDRAMGILNYLARKPLCSHELAVVSPDMAGVGRANTITKKLFGAPLTRSYELNIVNEIIDVKVEVVVLLRKR